MQQLASGLRLGGEGSSAADQARGKKDESEERQRALSRTQQQRQLRRYMRVQTLQLDALKVCNLAQKDKRLTWKEKVLS